MIPAKFNIQLEVPRDAGSTWCVLEDGSAVYSCHAPDSWAYSTWGQLIGGPSDGVVLKLYVIGMST